ncbi:3-ketosteroid-9-alpha-hydroxylase [Pseudarthrobacter sp. H2]|uniref:3-ketosteroid-9-alpha-hydroxylase n=1 Tax=Pseudarthrobacter sp. H2 TaxID=3418415 RepID=UPI003CF1DEB5
MGGVDSGQGEVRQIVDNGIPARFARGWHCLGLSRHFNDGKVRSLRAFGQELSLRTAADGRIHVFNEHCPLAAESSADTGTGHGSPACQVHGAHRFLPDMQAPCWEVLEQDGLLFVWNDTEGNPPAAAQSIPRICGAGSDEWTDWVWNEMVVTAQPRDIVDHIVDTASFFYASSHRPTFFKNVFEDHVATQYFDGPMRQEYSRHPLEDALPQIMWTNSVASYFGPSFMVDELDYVYETHDQSAVLINAHYPVDEHSLVLLSGVIVKRNEELGRDPHEFAADQAARILHGFGKDVEIWQKKTRIDNPLLCEEDGPVYQLRRWYEQFFRNVADVEPEMTDRFEYEMDTTLPVDTWQRSLARNLNSRKPTGRQPV